MNKKYMDFVPTKSTKADGNVGKVGRVRGVRRKVDYNTVVSMPTPNNTPKVGVSLGVIEDYSPKFVNTEVPKRPLSSGNGTMRSSGETVGAAIGNSAASGKGELKEVKSKKIGIRRAGKAVEKPVEKSAKKSVAAKQAKGVYQAPRTPFINQNQVVKRPLSKNVYQKKIPAFKEETSGPVTIISQPDKGKHVGLVVAIILTIILGAAAGTVAFLLLPK